MVISTILMLTLCLSNQAYGTEKNSVYKQEDTPKEWLTHPRLLFSAAEESTVQQQIKEDPLAEELYVRLLKEADSLLNVPVQAFLLREEYADLLVTSREQVYRTVTLALAYRLSKDKRYLKKSEEELLNVCNFPNWNPPHFLDVAEMTTAVAIGYDWLYSDLSLSTKKVIRESIKTKALDLAVKEYEHGKSGSWAKRETNWNIVCNTGMVMGALAIAEDYPELASTVVENAVFYMPNALKHFGPDGICFEGPSYWGYSTSYLSLVLSSLNMNFGQDFGLSAIEGIQKTVQYYIDTTSPSGQVFNFANSGTGLATNPVYFYFSKSFNQPEAAVFYRKIIAQQVKEAQIPKGYFFLALPWFDHRSVQDSREQKRLNVYKGINDIASFRANEKKANSIYLVAKGGDPDEAHQQMDVGTFIVESEGIRWTDDLGADRYSLPGFWDYKVNGQRWSYFRNSNLSHNTLAIDGKIQYAEGVGKIVSYDDQATQPYFTIDMSSVYEGQANRVLRTFTSLSDTKVRVRDDVQLTDSSKAVTWSVITAADIECIGNTAVLSRKGKKFRMTINSPEGTSFEVKPIPAPINSQEYPIKGYQLLQVTATDKQDVVFEIEMESVK